MTDPAYLLWRRRLAEDRESGRYWLDPEPADERLKDRDETDVAEHGITRTEGYK